MRQVRIVSNVTLDVCNFDWDLNEDRVYSRRFFSGEVYAVSEISPVDDFSDVIAFEMLGFCEIPREAWAFHTCSHAVCLN